MAKLTGETHPPLHFPACSYSSPFEAPKALPEYTGDIDEKLSHRPGGSDIETGATLSEKAKRFPDRLFELLNTEVAPASLYWLPGGKAFAIEQENFDKKVLDKYFQATKFASFVRRLHKWYVCKGV